MAWHNDQVTDFESKKIVEIARESLVFDGDLVELGCYKGDTSLLLADVIRGTDKRLWIYDSFEGLPAKNEKDNSEIGRAFCEGELRVTKREVKERFLRAGIRLPIIKKAWFSELNDDDLPREISFAFLDGDFYRSIKDSLALIEGRMCQGGVIVIHDYNNQALPGVARAVDEWMKERREKLERFETMAIIRVI